MSAFLPQSCRSFRFVVISANDPNATLVSEFRFDAWADSVMRADRDFYANPQWLQEWQLKNTWCDTCGKADLGMHSPKEYEERGSVYVSGLCNRCGNAVVSEVSQVDRSE